MGANDLSSLLGKKKLLVSDGATGTNLIQRGLPQGITAEQWVLENPDKIIQLHKDFIAAGSDIILTSTFGGSKIRLEQSNLGDSFREVNSRAVATCEKSCGKYSRFDSRIHGTSWTHVKTLGTP